MKIEVKYSQDGAIGYHQISKHRYYVIVDDKKKRSWKAESFGGVGIMGLHKLVAAYLTALFVAGSDMRYIQSNRLGGMTL